MCDHTWYTWWVDEDDHKVYLELSFLVSRPNDQKIVWVVSRRPNEFPNEAIITVKQTIKDNQEELDRVKQQINFVSNELKVTQSDHNTKNLTSYFQHLMR